MGKEQDIFAVVHLPRASALGGLVICSPLEAETARHYRKEVMLARRLAAAGVAVIRFHYRGHGNSRGHPHETSFQGMVDDTLRAIAHLRSRARTQSLALLGTRFGALVAGAAASSFDRAPLVLWEPAIDASSYFRQILRLRLMQDLRRGRSAASMNGLVEEIRTQGSVEVLGFAIPRSLYESSEDKALLGALGGTTRPILLVQIEGRKRLAAPYVDFISSCQRRGLAVDSLTIPEEVPWWFVQAGGDPIDSSPGTAALLEGTSPWVERRLQEATR